MHRSKAEIYLHFVWGTWRREPMVTPEIERAIYRCIEMECGRLRCAVLAVGGMPDHVHLVLRVPTTVSAAQVMKQVKGVSSTFGRGHCGERRSFGWQDNYAVRSFWPEARDRVVAYVLNQKDHHTKGDLWSDWEELLEETVGPPMGRLQTPGV